MALMKNTCIFYSSGFYELLKVSLPPSASNFSSSTKLASKNELLMTILGLQSSDHFRAERRFNATHGWAPGFDESRFDSYENIGNQQRSHTLPYNRTRGLCSS